MKRSIIFLLTLIGVFWASAFCCYAAKLDLQPLSAANQANFQQVQTMLARASYLFGDYKQTQKIAILPQPLISTGHFVLEKNVGLKWYQTTPFQSKLIVTSAKIEQQIAQNPPTIITKNDQPVVFSFTNIFLSVFNGDIKTINEYFKVYFAGDTAQWRIALQPIGSPLDKAITQIELSGSKYVTSITIDEAKNNQMLMQFSNVKEQE